MDIRILEDSENKVVLEWTNDEIQINRVMLNGNIYSQIIIPNTVSYLEKGYPELPRITKSIIIPDNARMEMRILELQEETRIVSPVIPSKGNLTRNIDPETVPYTFNEFYKQDRWFPEEPASLLEPFILRDYRGISVLFNPVRYNPVRNEIKITKRRKK